MRTDIAFVHNTCYNLNTKLMKPILLPERNLRLQKPVFPPGYKRGDVNRMFNKLFEHEKNYYSQN